MDFPAYLHNFRKTVMGENIISLSVDSAFSKQITDVLNIENGSRLLVRIEVADEEKEVAQNNDTKEKFRKTMHVKIREAATKTGLTEKEIKDGLKLRLRQKNLIKESTTELDIKGYAIACNILDEWN
mgnify:FL=1